jgi:hypothetical protein
VPVSRRSDSIKFLMTRSSADECTRPERALGGMSGRLPQLSGARLRTVVRKDVSMNPVRQDNIVVDPRSVVLEHLDAFNQHSSDRLLAGFSADAVWATGQDVFEGQAALRTIQ